MTTVQTETGIQMGLRLANAGKKVNFGTSSSESLELDPTINTDIHVVDLQKDIKRCIVNREIMMLYGHDTTGYLPPLPKQERPRSSSAPAWSCGNPAVRQLANVSRRGPRSRLPGQLSSNSVTSGSSFGGYGSASGGGGMGSSSTASLTLSLPTRPSTAMSEVNTRSRPHTAYTAFIKTILNRRVSELSSRPSTALGLIDHVTPRRALDDDLDRVVFPSQMALRADDAMDQEDLPDPGTVSTSDHGTRRKSPRLMRNNHRRKKREKKKKTATVDAKRNAEIMKVLKGDFDAVPAEPSTVVRVYICACSMDMEEERRALQHQVYPELRSYCRRLGLDFHVVDLRGGADFSIDQDYSTSGVYSKEVQACQQLSVGPAFLMILGDKYGVAPLPSRIDANEFEVMKKMAEEERLPNHFLLDEWYVRDDNALPPVYVLQRRPVEVKGRRGRRRKDASLMFTDKRMRQQIYAQIQQVLQEAISVSMEEGKLIYQERKHKYFKASVEEEVLEGVLHCKSTADKCLCYIREISDLPRNVYNEDTCKYADMIMRHGQQEAKPDAQARKYLQQMKGNVHSKLEETNNLRYYEPSLAELTQGEFIPDEEDPDRLPYIQQFVTDVLTDMKTLTERAKDVLDAHAHVKHYKLYKQVLPHASRVQEVCEDFIGREDVFAAVQAYLKDSERCGKPLVIQGPAGYGKTSCMGMLAKRTKMWFGPSSIVVFRFVSETLHTADIKEVLYDICMQLSVVYGMDPIPKEATSNIYRMAAAFNAYLTQLSKWHAEKKPLILLLDGLDQLNKKHRAHSMQWLPAQCPPNVYMILSIETSCKAVNDCLQRRLAHPQCFLDLGEVDADTVDLMVNTALGQANRVLQPEQKDFLLRNGKANPHPIYLALTIKEALTWCSYTKIDDDHVPTTAEDAISRVLDRLETKYGLKLVRDTVSYLVMAPTGLTETELTDTLSINDEVLQDVFIQHDLPLDDIIVMPSFLIASLLDDMQVFLIRRNKDNRTVLAWRNRTYRALCAKKYFGVTDPLNPPNEESQHYCHDLAEIFLQDAGINKQFEHPMTYTVIEKTDRQVTPQVLVSDNFRKLKLLPYYIMQSGRTGEVLEDLRLNCFCNFQWLMTKMEGLGVDCVLDELYLIDVRDNDLLLMRDLIWVARHGLRTDHETFAGHVLGMVPNINTADYPGVATLVNESKRWIETSLKPIIVPMVPCLPSPLDLCKQKFWGVIEVLALDQQEQVAVMRNKDNSVDFWDVECEQMIVSTGMRYDHVDPNIYCSANSMAIYNSTKVFVWDIFTCSIASTVELDKLFGDSLSTTIHMYNTENFELIVLQCSDDDFNQSVNVVDTVRGVALYSIPDFDLKDEFYRNSALLVRNDELLVFVSARSESLDDGSTRDDAMLNIYNLHEKAYTHRVPLGHKKFSRIIPNDKTAVLCWADASFDVYNLDNGTQLTSFAAPDKNLSMKMCELTLGNNLFFLASPTGEDVRLLYSALWCWNLQEQQLSQFFIKRHARQEEVFQHFILCDMESFAVLTSPKTATIWLWDLQGRRPIRSIRSHTDSVTSLVGRKSDSYSFFSGSTSEGVVKRWDVYQTVTAALSGQMSFRVRTPSAMADYGILKRQGSRHKLGSAKSGKSVRFADGYGDDSVSSTGSSRPGTATLEEVGGTPPRSPAPIDVAARTKETVEKAMEKICWVALSQNGKYVVSGYEKGLPVLWDACVGDVIHKMAPQTASDFGTPWVAFASKDKYVVGLTNTEKSPKGAPFKSHMFQIWATETGQAVRLPTDMYATACTLTLDTEKVLLATIDQWDPNAESHDMAFRLLNLTEQTVVHTIVYNTTVVPTSLHLTEDDKCAVTDNVNAHGKPDQHVAMFTIETAQDHPKVMFYEFLKGKKYPEYRVTKNYVMKNGLALAVGLNGDMQIWDIPSCEYEGNLCEDPAVKDTQNPSLHTHGGFNVLQVAVSVDGRYLLVGSEDCTASLWDMENETMIHRYRAHTGQVTAVALSEEVDGSRLVVTAGEDLMLNVWHFGVVDAPVCRLPIYLAPHTLQITADNKTVVAVGHTRNQPDKLLLFRLRNIQPAPGSEQTAQIVGTKPKP